MIDSFFDGLWIVMQPETSRRILDFPGYFFEMVGEKIFRMPDFYLDRYGEIFYSEYSFLEDGDKVRAGGFRAC